MTRQPRALRRESAAAELQPIDGLPYAPLNGAGATPLARGAPRRPADAPRAHPGW